MKLKIVEHKSGMEKGTYILDFHEFGMKEYQPFLATQEWDRVDVELKKGMPAGILRQMSKAKVIVPHFDSKNITAQVMYLLCEIAKDDAANIRLTYMKDRDNFEKLINELACKYGWDLEEVSA